ncbi:MAG: DUF1464 family protein [Gemmataceae bacterium]|nr:DUF1464 family protein [Gemmataceae bacterium]
MALRVAGMDPGTSSLDVLVLEDGAVAGQVRFDSAALRADPGLPVRWLVERGPLDLIAGPSGYGLPLIRLADCTDRDFALMSLMRADDLGRRDGLVGLSALLPELRAAGLPVVFLPGVIHLATVPIHRKLNRVDLGTPDKLCVAALALDRHAAKGDLRQFSACVVELGSAFSACVVLRGGKIVAGLGGTSGLFGAQSGGAWDGEAAYVLSPLAKHDLFTGGLASAPDPMQGQTRFRESLLQAIAGLQTVAPFDHMILSGRLLETEPALADAVTADLRPLGTVERLPSLPGAWVKHAAQGAAILANGLAGGASSPLVEHLELRRAAGSILDWLCYPRAAEVRAFWHGP